MTDSIVDLSHMRMWERLPEGDGRWEETWAFVPWQIQTEDREAKINITDADGEWVVEVAISSPFAPITHSTILRTSKESDISQMVGVVAIYLHHRAVLDGMFGEIEENFS